jgi:hypothetical protein
MKKDSFRMSTVFSTNVLAKTGVLLALTLAFQIWLQPYAQPVVGPLVNMMLIITVLLVGTIPAIVIGCLTPLVAFLVGIMPLMPVVPFIMVGNAVMVLLFSLTRSKLTDYGALALGAYGKFAFLAFSVRYLLILFVPQVPPRLVAALSLPQLYTALIGGLIAIILAKRLRFLQK